MIQYILESIAFQLVFLIIYDFFLKRETFFQWNRVYLIGTYVLSMVLPWIKIEALKTSVPSEYYVYPEFLWNADNIGTTVAATESSTFNISWGEGILFGGIFLAALYFVYKLYQISKLRKNGSVQDFPNFTRIVVKNSELAFSFFKSIFLGDKVIAREHKSIIQHELVHIEQKHTWDLLFFEMMRIVGWFNPLVYVYQSRISELHEFIADAKVAKTHKKEQYEFLLSQVFQTENISFINQFLKSSLIKKRIIMLQKTKSKNVWQLKYLLLLPLVLGMLFYTSSEAQNKEEISHEKPTEDSALIKVKDVENLTFEEEKNIFFRLKITSTLSENWELLVTDDESYIKFTPSNGGSYITGPSGEQVRAQQILNYKPSTDELNAYQDLIASRTKKQYDELLNERERLLKSMDKNNPIILNLDEQLNALKKSIGTSMQDESRSMPQDTILVTFATVDEVPVFPGCEDDADKRGCFHEKMRQHIRKNFNYPKEAQDKGLQGRVAIMFTMNTDGNIVNVKVRGPHKLLEDEAVRIISRLPKFKPGVHEGNKANVIFSIPITFKLTGNADRTEQTDLMTQYQELAMERNRLLKSAEERDPILVNLDQQMGALKQRILEEHDGTVAFAWVDKVPVFPGCENAENSRECFQKSMQKHISKNFRYPEEAQEKGIQGRVNIMFTISQDGSIQNVKTRGPDQLLEKEAVRIIGLLPKMSPGKQKEEIVNVPFSIPITFKLQGEENEAIKLVLDHGSDRAYVIDGVEATKEEYEALNPESDIESLSIYHKEGAIKKYGEKGKNGVIEVKTKKKN